MDRGPEGFGPSRAEAGPPGKVQLWGPGQEAHLASKDTASSSTTCGRILGNIRAVSALSVEALKAVEIEKCKSDIKKMKEELAARGTRWVCVGWAGEGGPC